MDSRGFPADDVPEQTPDRALPGAGIWYPSPMQAPILAFIGGSTGGGEILIILVVMLLLFGSKKLPQMARSMGRAMEEFRRASREVTDEIMRADLKDEPKPALQPRALASTDPETPDADNEPESAPSAPQAPAQAVNRDETLS